MRAPPCSERKREREGVGAGRSCWAAEQATLGRARTAEEKREGTGEWAGRPGCCWPKAEAERRKKKKKRWAASATALERKKGKKD